MPARVRHRYVSIVLATLLPWLALSGVAPAATPATPTIDVSLVPISPYTSGGCFDRSKPCYRVRGTADPGIRVIVTVTDEVSDQAVTEVIHAARVDDPGAKVAAGDWAASPNVTNLGTHGDDPSPLTFTATTEADDGNRSASASVTVEKVSRTPGDVTPPRVTVTRSPPGTWCHLGPTGVAIEPVAGVVVGVCAPALMSPLDPGYGSWGVRQITGRVEDIDETFGIGSEIADVVITITKSDGSDAREIRSFTRRGTAAFFETKLFITDFEPGTYEWVVYALDAWGHKSQEVTGNFVVAIL